VLPSDLDYCIDQLRRLDRDRFLAALAAPAELRADLMVLYAFNTEVARVRESVSEQMLGLIRLQWWREAVAEIFAGKPRRHAVVTPLAEMVRRRDLSEAPFLRLIEARERDLDNDPPQSIEELEAYARATSGSLIELALEICGVGLRGREVAIAHHVGIAYALTGLLRATLYHARDKRLMLPQSVLTETGVSAGQLFELRNQPALRDAVKLLAKTARGHLASARKLHPPRRAIPALLVGRLAAVQLERLKRRGYDLFDYRSIEASPLDLWRLGFARLLGKI
jgi:phytoene/squalene synthetase